MFDFFRKLISSEPTERPIDPRVAAAALLVEAALIDGVYANLESDVIIDILLNSFGFDAAKADAVLEQAEALAEEASDSQRFTKRVKTLPLNERRSIIEGLYRVVLADGEKSAIEESFVRRISGLLYIDDVSRARAKQNAEATLSG